MGAVLIRRAALAGLLMTVTACGSSAPRPLPAASSVGSNPAPAPSTSDVPRESVDAPPSPSGSPAAASASASAPTAAAAEAVVRALNELDRSITANRTPTGLTSDEAGRLQQYVDDIRAAVDAGDGPGARSAFDELVAKVDTLTPKLATEQGARLTAAIAALRQMLAVL